MVNTKEKLTNKDIYGIIWERSVDGIKAGCIIVWCIGQGRKNNPLDLDIKYKKKVLVDT